MVEQSNAAPRHAVDGAPEELARRLHQQQLEAEFGLLALKTRDLQTTLDEAVRICALGLSSEFCKLLEFLPEEGNFLVRAGTGWKPGVVGKARINVDTRSPAGLAFATGTPVLTNHLDEDPRFRTPALLVEHGIHCAINVIIRGDGAPFGVLEVDSAAQGLFTVADTIFLQAVANLLGVAIERQAIEAELREKETQLREALAHQDVLTREISHRVKNSLAIVGSLLRMQARSSTDENLQRALADAQSRVETIASVHDHLWRRRSADELNLDQFLDGLCQQLTASGPGHAIVCRVPPVTVAGDQAVLLGLLTNELVTNAFKYAYDRKPGEVYVSVTPIDERKLRFEVRDHGLGLPPDLDASKARSLGMKLIASMAGQLGGAIEWADAGPGTRFTLEFEPAPATHR